MRHSALLPIALALLAACAPKPAVTADASIARAARASAGGEPAAGADVAAVGEPPPPPPPKLEPLPVDAVLWEGDVPEGVEPSSLLDKEGILTRMKKPTENQARWWPFGLDYWGIARTDLKALLEPHIGRRVRVTGHYKKIYSDGTWDYEVEPVKITALADAPATAGETAPAP